MVVVVSIVLAIKLFAKRVSAYSNTPNMRAYQVQNRYFHHALIEICGLVFDYFDGHDLLRL
jgi:hypothetical protein